MLLHEASVLKKIRLKVRAITEQPFRSAVAEVLSDVPAVIYKFHEAKEVKNALDSIRVSMRKDMTKPAKYRYSVLPSQMEVIHGDGADIDVLPASLLAP